MSERHEKTHEHHHSSHRHHHSSHGSDKSSTKIQSILKKRKPLFIAIALLILFASAVVVISSLDKKSTTAPKTEIADNAENVDEFGFAMGQGKTIVKGTSYTIHGNENIIEGLQIAYDNKCSKVIVEEGTYDVIKEYKTKFGSDYFTNYEENYNNCVNGTWDYGIWLQDIEICFSPGAKVVCYYDGSNENVTKYFSPFAVGKNVIIDGLVLDAKECRYGIHPDFGHDSEEMTYLVIKNCDLKHYAKSRYENNQAIGAGLDEHCVWTIEHNIFRLGGGYRKPCAEDS